MAANTPSPFITDLLEKQCEDLKALLSCAQRESIAAANANFDELLEIVGERNKIGERLKIYQKEIDELRDSDFEAIEVVLDSEAATQNRILMTKILETDRTTLPVLVSSRDKISRERLYVDKVKEKVSAFSHTTNIPVIYDKHA